MIVCGLFAARVYASSSPEPTGGVVGVTAKLYRFFVMDRQLNLETVDLAPATPVAVSRVTWAASAPAPERFVHLHQVVELVLFESVQGALNTDGAVFELGARAAVLLPSMAAHDFYLGPGAAAWTLVHYHPHAASSDVGPRPLCVTLAPRDHVRLMGLCDWLSDAVAANRAAEARQVLDVILTVVMRSRPRPGAEGPAPRHLARLRPVLEWINGGNAPTLSLPDAAALCHLSPSYFSRLFRETFGHTFASHMSQVRLKAAALHLAATDAPIKAISYEAGFHQHAYFTAQFRKLFGQTPSDFRAAARARRTDGRGRPSSGRR